MSWIAVGTVAVGAVASYASASSAEDASKENSEQQIKAQKELEATRRSYQLQDRKAKEDAIGAWGKYADPYLTGQQLASGPQAPGAPTDSSITQKAATAIDDPNNPLYAAAPVEAGRNAMPINHPAPFAGMQNSPQSLWFARQYPSYDPNNPTGEVNG